MITGSAPISAEVLDFMKVCICCPIMEAYGQTETSGGVFTTDCLDGYSGQVGGPTPNVEFKLIDIPDMNYLSTDKNLEGES